MAEEFAFNQFDPQTRRDPFPLFARARREHPVFPHPGFPIVSVFRYADIQSILKDPETWSNRLPPPPGIAPALVPEPSMLGQDPPQHPQSNQGVVLEFPTPVLSQPYLSPTSLITFPASHQSAAVDAAKPRTSSGGRAGAVS
jgi:cytochrome P450